MLIKTDSINNVLPLQVLKSAAGFYIGRVDSKGLPFSRNSVEYWQEKSDADQALRDNTYTPRNWA